jgi:hypothetical protein
MPFAVLFAIFALALDLLHSVTRDRRLSWPFTLSGVTFWQSA